MKKVFSIILGLSMMLSLTVFAEEEFSDNADIDYDYNESYDENHTQEETTSNRYDDISSSYDENFDEINNEEYGEEYSDEPEPEYDSEYNMSNDKTTQSDVISVFVNDEKIYFDVNPMLINDRTMVPVRAIFEALGATVTWDNNTQTAKGVLGDTVIEITIGSSYLLKNGKVIELDSPAVVISDRTLVPVRAIAESFDCAVNWYGETQVVEILK